MSLTRLVPVFLFFLRNYALRLARIRTTRYILATHVFVLPAIFAFTYADRELAPGDEELIQKGLPALGLLAAIVFLPRFVGRLRRRGMESMAPREAKNKYMAK